MLRVDSILAWLSVALSMSSSKTTHRAGTSEKRRMNCDSDIWIKQTEHVDV